MKARIFSMRAIAIAVIILAALMLLTVPIWTNRWANVDFPCEWFGPPPGLARVDAASRIAYCITMYPRSAYGAYPLAYGSTDQDEAAIMTFPVHVLRRQGTSILVDDRPLAIGETLNRHLVTLSPNPWLLATTDLRITNEGYLAAAPGGSESPAPQAIYVSGDATEGWAPTPLGLLFFALGVGLLLLGAKQRTPRPKT